MLLQQFHRSSEAALSSLRDMESWTEFTAYLGFHLTFRNWGEVYLFFMPGQFKLKYTTVQRFVGK